VDGTFQTDENAMAQLIGVAILEFGVILHRHISSIAYPHHPAQLTEPAPSVLIGLTLAVDEKFKVLFVVIIFHRGYYLSIDDVSDLNSSSITLSQKHSKASELAHGLRTLSSPTNTALYPTSARSFMESRRP
jgi:hypothetical protein